MDADSKCINLLDNFDIVMARQAAREMARDLGFGLTDQARIATAISEVARRALESQGNITFTFVEKGQLQGIECVCLQCDWHRTSEPHSSLPSSKVLGGVERLMDDFEVKAIRGRSGTTVIMRKWIQRS